MAEDGKKAQIKVTTAEYFQLNVPQGTYVQSELQQIETGTILNITPRIGVNGDLTLDMNIEVSDVIARGEQNLPVVSRRTAQSTVRIHDGGTAAIAGLMDTRSQLGRAGIPGAWRSSAARPRVPHRQARSSDTPGRHLHYCHRRQSGRQACADRSIATASDAVPSTRMTTARGLLTALDRLVGPK